MLVAIAVYEPISLLELQRCVGLSRSRTRTHVQALLRMGLCARLGITSRRTVKADWGVRLKLDPRFPLYGPLKRFLRALGHAIKPSPVQRPLDRRRILPLDPGRSTDLDLLLGDRAPTRVLVLIHLLGRTTSSRLADLVGGNRQGQHDMLKRLAIHGLIARQKTPRCVALTLNPAFPAAAEFANLLSAIANAKKYYHDLAKRDRLKPSI